MRGEDLELGAVNLVLLACVFKGGDKKGRQLFREKSAPPEKILATPMMTSVDGAKIGETPQLSEKVHDTLSDAEKKQFKTGEINIMRHYTTTRFCSALSALKGT